MAPIWPFKKKPVAVAEKEIVKSTYSRGGDSAASDSLADRSHVEDDSFKAAMASLSTPHIAAVEGGNIAPTSETTTSPVLDSSPITVKEETNQVNKEEVREESDGNWVNHSDGYWYLQKPDGSFLPTPHVKDSSGDITPFVA